MSLRVDVSGRFDKSRYDLPRNGLPIRLLVGGVAPPDRIDEVNWKLAIAEGDRAAHQIFSLRVAFNRILRRVAIFGLSAQRLPGFGLLFSMIFTLTFFLVFRQG